jgi:hypothetical protein
MHKTPFQGVLPRGVLSSNVQSKAPEAIEFRRFVKYE